MTVYTSILQDSRHLKRPCVSILASARDGTLYAGVTSDVVKRIWEHKNDVADGFTKRYQIHTLVYAEFHATMEAAILRRSRSGTRMLELTNPDWRDLYEEFSQ